MEADELKVFENLVSKLFESLPSDVRDLIEGGAEYKDIVKYWLESQDGTNIMWTVYSDSVLWRIQEFYNTREKYLEIKNRFITFNEG